MASYLKSLLSVFVPLLLFLAVLAMFTPSTDVAWIRTAVTVTLAFLVALFLYIRLVRRSAFIVIKNVNGDILRVVPYRFRLFRNSYHQELCAIVAENITPAAGGPRPVGDCAEVLGLDHLLPFDSPFLYPVRLTHAHVFRHFVRELTCPSQRDLLTAMIVELLRSISLGRTSIDPAVLSQAIRLDVDPLYVLAVTYKELVEKYPETADIPELRYRIKQLYRDDASRDNDPLYLSPVFPWNQLKQGVA
jgi:hypothetical protein